MGKHEVDPKLQALEEADRAYSDALGIPVYTVFGQGEFPIIEAHVRDGSPVKIIAPDYRATFPKNSIFYRKREDGTVGARYIHRKTPGGKVIT